MNTYFAVCAPGLEPYTAAELRQLLPGREIGIEPGGAAFSGEPADLQRLNLQLRTASRVLARLGTFFRATTFDELQQRAARLPWERFLRPGQPVALRVTCHQSKLYHSDAVARHISAALDERLGQPCPLVKTDDESDQPPQLIVIRLMEDRVTVSVDSSGTILHKRGYRQAVAKAPLRETLAAAILLASGWDRSAPLLDPFSGSGTIPIEAALLAAGIPPGWKRRFAFMDWPDFDEKTWQGFLAEANVIRAETPPILASDRDAGAVKMAQANAERAGVSGRIEFKCQAVSAVAPPPGPGWVVTNPPYGLRVSEGRDLRNLYAQFGNVLLRKCPGWQVAVLCSDPVLFGQMQVELDTSLALVNGGVHVRLGRGTVGQQR